MNIKLNSLGYVQAHKNIGPYIFIEHDEKDTGGYYIYHCSTFEKKEGYDSWVLNMEELKNFFQGVSVKWLE